MAYHSPSDPLTRFSPGVKPRSRIEALTPFRIGVILAVLISLLRLASCSYLERVDVRSVDFRLLQRGMRMPGSDVAIVAIDDESLEEVGRWPWPRAVQALLVERITSADPAVIGFDIVQSERTHRGGELAARLRNAVPGSAGASDAQARFPTAEDVDEDALLADAIKKSKRSVLGYFFLFRVEGRGAPAVDGERISTYNLVQGSPNGRGEGMILEAVGVRGNLPEITAGAREVGFFDIVPDPLDGTVRSIPLAIRYGPDVAIPLSLAMLRSYRPGATLGIRFAEFGVEKLWFGSTVIPVTEDGHLLINYRGRRRTFPCISAVDVLRGRASAEALRGKMVLVGVTAKAVADIRVTPFDPILPGVEIHATAIDNVLQGDFMWRPKWVVLVEVGTIVFVCLLLGIALNRARGVLGLVIAVSLVGGYLLLSQSIFQRSGLPLSFIYPILAITLTYIGIGVQHFVAEEGEKRKVRKALELYLSPSMARIVSEQPERLKLGGEKRDLTVLFSDIRGFTSISEGLDPEKLVELLNVYLGEMTDAVFVHDGMLDKYIGDAVMAVWGAPLPQPDHARRACAAALEMLGRLHRVNEHAQARGWPHIKIGVGLNTGPMVFGNMGSVHHLSLTVMGDNVNLGSRLEGLTKMYGASIIASEWTVAEAGNVVVAREIDLVRVKGKAQAVRIFELLGRESEREQWTWLIERSNAGIEAYRQQRWTEALAIFGAILKERPEDGLARLYAERCSTLMEAPPPPEWDGVTVMETK